MPRWPKSVGEFILAGLSVLSFVALVVWAIGALQSSHSLLAKESLDGKLVIFLGLLWLTTFVWGWRRGRGRGGDQHHYHGPVTQIFSPQIIPDEGPPRASTVPVTPEQASQLLAAAPSPQRPIPPHEPQSSPSPAHDSGDGSKLGMIRRNVSSATARRGPAAQHCDATRRVRGSLGQCCTATADTA